MVFPLPPHPPPLTGPPAAAPPEELAESAAPLAGLKATHGVFFITGNHEYYSGVEAWLPVFSRMKARTLLNEHVVLRHGGEQIVIGGVTDYSPDWTKAAAGAPVDAVKVLLAHHPEGLEQATAAGFHLQLSGHTHGGQFFPFSVFVRLRHKYYKGLYRVGALWLYVSRGTGY